MLLIIVAAAAYLLMGNGTPAQAATTTVAATTSGGSSTVQATTTAVASESGPSVAIRSNATYGGAYLANMSGYTLYVYKGDVQNSGISSCGGPCANIWPPFYSANLTVAPGLSTSEFAVINRTGSGITHQLTYNGWPLYRYVQDTKPGEISGNGIANFEVALK